MGKKFGDGHWYTLEEILNGEKGGTPRWGFIKLKKETFVLAKVEIGKGYAPVVELDIDSAAQQKLFYDLYCQLKGIFEGVKRDAH